MRHSPSILDIAHTAGTDAAPGRGVVRAAAARAGGRAGGIAHVIGTAVTPRTETLVLARGTHRTRVSEMRLLAARVATRRPDLSDAVRHAAAERNWGSEGRRGTG